MVINKRIKRRMMEHKSTYLVSIALLILSTAMFTLFNTTGPAIKDIIENFKNDYNVEDAYFTTSIPLEEIKGIEEKFDISIEDLEWKDFKVVDKVNLRVYKEREKINLHQVVKGNDIESTGDIVVNEDFYKVNGLELNEKLKIGEKEYLLKGKSTSPDYLYMLENDSSILVNKETFAVGFISKEDFKSIENPNRGYSIKFNKDNKEEFKNYIKDKYFLLNWVDQENNTKIVGINGDLNGIFKLGEYAPIIIMIMVSLIIAILVAKTIKSELTQLGTLYALGYKKKILIKHYMTYPVAIAVIGGIIGQLPGTMSYGVITKMLEVEYSLPKIIIGGNIKIIIFSILIPLLIIIPINFIIIWRTLSHSAVDLMKGTLKDDGPSFLEKRVHFKGLSFKNRFKIKDILRNMGRTMLTLISVCFCGMLLFLAFVMNQSMGNVVNKGYADAYQFKNLYILSNISTENKGGEKFWILDVESENKSGDKVSFELQGREKESKLIKLNGLDGNRLSFRENIITSSLAEKLGIKEGDEVTIKSDFNNSSFKVKIDKIADYYTSQTIYVPLEVIYQNTTLPEGSYMGIVSNEDIKFNSGELSSSITKDAIIDGANRMISPLKGITYVIGIISAMIGIAIIYVIVSMVIEENRTNISMFKIMGYEDKNLTKIILNINDLLVLIGFLISIPLSKVALTALFNEVTKSMDFTIQIEMSPMVIFIVFMIILIIYEISKQLSKRKILRIPMEEVLNKGRE